MQGPEIIDMHVHLCRDSQQEQVVFPKRGWPEEWYWGSPDRVLPYMDARNISHVATMNVIDTKRMVDQRINRAHAQGASQQEVDEARVTLQDDMRERVRSFNTSLLEAAQREPRIITYAYANPVLFGDETMDELERCIGLGAPGIKVHPSISAHYPDHPTMMQVYERCQEAGLGVLSDSRGEHGGDDFGMPRGWTKVLQTFPHLKFIMAHLVDEMWDDRLEMAAEFKDNLWFDIAGGLVDERHPAGGHACMPAVQAARVFRKVGIERVLFGTDAPSGGAGRDILDCANQVIGLELTEAEKEQILSGNAKQFLGLKQ
ncbi:MAG: amidohydrolase family protein [Dehalococcoidia bacterium]